MRLSIGMSLSWVTPLDCLPTISIFARPNFIKNYMPYRMTPSVRHSTQGITEVHRRYHSSSVRLQSIAYHVSDVNVIVFDRQQDTPAQTTTVRQLRPHRRPTTVVVSKLLLLAGQNESRSWEIKSMLKTQYRLLCFTLLHSNRRLISLSYVIPDTTYNDIRVLTNLYAHGDSATQRMKLQNIACQLT